MLSRPSHLPSWYKISAPRREPRVVQMIAESKFIFPWLEVNPASGRITSLGSGGKIFSAAIKRAAPKPPSFSIIAIDQSTIFIVIDESAKLVNIINRSNIF